jgi:hypothetical protein
MTTTRPDETTTAAVQPTAKKVTAAEVEAGRRTALGRLAAKCYDGRRLVLGIWVALLIVINVLAFAEPVSSATTSAAGTRSHSRP